jgi:signal transduction histidine kinase/ActR/RegA family two-component response regulator
MNPYALIPLVCFVLSQSAWAYIFAKKRTPLSRAYLVFAAAANAWTAMDFLTWAPVPVRFIEPIIRVMALAYIPTGALFLNFVYQALEKRRDLPYYLCFASVIVSIAITVPTNLVMDGYEMRWWGANMVRGPFYDFVMVGAMSVPVVLSIALLAHAVVRKERQRKSLGLVLAGTVILFIAAYYTDVVLPEDRFSLASCLVFVLTVFVFLAVRRHGFMMIDLEASAYDLFQNISDAVLIVGRDGRVRLSNRAAHDLFAGRAIEGTVAGELLEAFELGAKYADHETSVRGEHREVSVSQAPVQQGVVPIGWILIVRDLTKRQRLQDEIIKRQRLETVGVLAGGIAHDFNNILTAVLTNIGLAKAEDLETRERDALLADAERAAHNAKNLTEQLLTFAKGGEPIRRPVAIDRVVMSWTQLALSGANVRARYDFPRGLWAVFGDKGQLGQMVNNIAVNAKQAMPGGGEVAIEARNVVLEAGNPMLLPPGDYVRISFEDRGTGIPPEVLPHIFDPYVTTKESGSGLGLASTYSIVQRHGGHIGATSEPGEGSVFTIHLPGLEEAQVSLAPPTPYRARGQGTVLVMDDEELILRACAKVLAAGGYHAVLARDGAEAVRLYGKALEAGGRYDAVVMDLTVPGGMGGQQAIRELLALDPGVRAIVSSGYCNDPVMANYAAYGFRAVVAKPYVMDELLEAVERVLAEPSEPPASTPSR